MDDQDHYMASEPSLSDVMYRLDRLQKAVDNMDDRYLGNREYQSDQRGQAVRDKTHDRRISRIEDSVTWLMRGLAGLAFAVLIQVVVAVLFLGGSG